MGAVVAALVLVTPAGAALGYRGEVSVDGPNAYWRLGELGGVVSSSSRSVAFLIALAPA